MKTSWQHTRVRAALAAATFVCITALFFALTPCAMAIDDSDPSYYGGGVADSVYNHEDETVTWGIDIDGTLVIKPTNGSKGYMDGYSYNCPWKELKQYIKHAKIEAGVSVQSAAGLFDHCARLENIEGLDTLDISNVTNLDYMFDNCSKLTAITIPKTSSSITSIIGMFRYCSSLKSVDLTGLSECKISSMDSLFQNCSSLESVKIDMLNVSSVISTSLLFDGCSSLKSVTLPTFDSSKLRDISHMFQECSSLEKVTGLGGLQPASIEYLFYGCASLKDLKDVEFDKLDTSLVAEFSYLFCGCSQLESIDISNKMTARTTALNDLFNGCTSLKEIKGLETVDTRNITSISRMFSGCSSLESIDLSGIDLSISQDNASDLFQNCTNLATIYDDGGFVISSSSSTNTGCLFYGCYKLIGGSGTSYSGWYWKQNEEEGTSYLQQLSRQFNNASYARVDGGPSSQTPGLFTQKGSTPHVHVTVDWSTTSSCTTTGYKGGKQCSTCGTIIDRGETVYGRWHTYPDTYAVENEVSATEDSYGFYDKVWRCTVCNEVLKTTHVMTTTNGNDASYYPTHTLTGTTVPDAMKFERLDKKDPNSSWTAEEAAYYISQGLCLIGETLSYDAKNETWVWDTNYVSESSAKKILELAFTQFDGSFGWEVANTNVYLCCSRLEYNDATENRDGPSYDESHNKHYYCGSTDRHDFSDCLFRLIDFYYKDADLDSAAALNLLGNFGRYLEEPPDKIGYFLLKAFPNGSASTSQLDKIGCSLLCEAIADSTSLKALKTSATLYKTICDYIINNASGYYQITIANKIQLERNSSSGSGSGGSSSGGSSSGGSSAGGSTAGGTSQADVAALKSEIASLKQELATLKEELNKSKKDPTSDTESIETLTATITTLQNSLDAMKSALSQTQDNLNATKNTLAQTQDSLALGNVSDKINRTISHAVGTVLKLNATKSASGAKAAFKAVKNKHFSLSKSGKLKVIGKLKKGKMYTVKTVVSYGNQNKAITLKIKAK